MRTILSLSCFFLLTIPTLFAQINADIANPDNQRIVNVIGNLTPTTPGIPGFDTRYEGVRGSAYLFEDWTKGNIQFNSKDTTVTNLQLNLNAEQQFLVVEFENGQVGTLSSNGIEAVRFFPDTPVEQVFKPLSSAAVEGASSGQVFFYQVLFDQGPVSFFRKEQRKLLKANNSDPMMVNTNYDEFISEVKYFLLNENGESEKIKLKSNSIIKALENLGYPTKKVVKEKVIDLSTPQGVVQLLAVLEEI